jgi:hypothetical protein
MGLVSVIESLVINCGILEGHSPFNTICYLACLWKQTTFEDNYVKLYHFQTDHSGE